MNISPDKLLAMQNNNAVVIDIRTEEEWQETGIIPESRTLEFFDSSGSYNTERWLKQFQAQRRNSQQAVILVCRSGNRSKRVGDFLATKLDMENIYHLEKGITSWIKAGKQTEIACLTHMACNER